MTTASSWGSKPLPEALTIARSRELDLVEVAPNADPPVCRLMDFKRYEYEQQQRRKESRRKATQVVIKEMKFRPKIDVHDYTTKMRHVERFLAEGNKVKLTIMFRGREMAHPELGLRILERIADEVSESGDGRVGPPTRRPEHDDGAAPPQARRPQDRPGQAHPARPDEHPDPPVAAPRHRARPAPANGGAPAGGRRVDPGPAEAS